MTAAHHLAANAAITRNSCKIADKIQSPGGWPTRSAAREMWKAQIEMTLRVFEPFERHMHGHLTARRQRNRIAARLTCAIIAVGGSSAAADPAPITTRPPFTATLSNTTPLVFGMDAEQASRALGQPLEYVSGRPGNEIFLVLRDLGGSGLVPHRHRLFLQFRQGRLSGWKEDYGRNWMWQ